MGGQVGRWDRAPRVAPLPLPPAFFCSEKCASIFKNVLILTLFLICAIVLGSGHPAPYTRRASSTPTRPLAVVSAGRLPGAPTRGSSAHRPRGRARPAAPRAPPC